MQRRAKGIIAKPMPSYWYNIRDTIPREGDSDNVIKQKNFNKRIVAANKPYFMMYVYPELRRKNNQYEKNSERGAIARFGSFGIQSIEDLRQYENKTPEMVEYLTYYERYKPVGDNNCIVNRICHLFESTFDGYLTSRYKQPDFDYSILKSNVGYSKYTYAAIYQLYCSYTKKFAALTRQSKLNKYNSVERNQSYHNMVAWFKKECSIICCNEKELCDIVIDICYSSKAAKQFAWDVCGQVIIDNLLERNNGVIHYPLKTDEVGEFEYCGERFIMQEKDVVNE